MSVHSEILGCVRAGRGAPTSDGPRWDEETDALAARIAASWRSLREQPDGDGRWLRRALTQHAAAVLKLFQSGVRLSHLARALMRQKVTLDDGRPLNVRAVVNSWLRIEEALARKVQAKRRAR